MSYYNHKTKKLSKTFSNITLSTGDTVSIYPITRNLFDVFYGEGFYNCARIRNTRKGLEVLRNVGNTQLFTLEMQKELESKLGE